MQWFIVSIIVRSKKHNGSAPVFSGFMYSYMKALSLSDMAFLFVTFQVSWKTNEGNFCTISWILSIKIIFICKNNFLKPESFFQYCYAVAKHYLLTKDYIEPSSRGMEVYVWRLITPTWNLCCCVSDMIIVAMTVDRYLIHPASFEFYLIDMCIFFMLQIKVLPYC